MILAEACLLEAVLTRLRQPLGSGGAGYGPTESEIEYDEQAAAIAGDTYVAVVPGGVQPGPRHNSSGGVFDLVFGVDVLVVKRCTSVPRDRRRDLFARNMRSLIKELHRVMVAIDFKYEVTTLANTMYGEDAGTLSGGTGFVHPLVFTGNMSKPQLVGGEFFASKNNESAAGIKRTISFGGARWLLARS